MKFRKIMLLAIFLVSLLAVSLVSAADNVTSDKVTVSDLSDSVSQSIEISDSSINTTCDDLECEDILESSDDGSALELEDEVILESTECDVVSIDESSWFFKDVVWYDGDYNEITHVDIHLIPLEDSITIFIEPYENMEVISEVDLAILNDYDHKIIKLPSELPGITSYNFTFNAKKVSFCVGFWYNETHLTNYANVNQTTIYSFNWCTWDNRTWYDFNLNNTGENYNVTNNTGSNNNTDNAEYLTFTALQYKIDNATDGSTITLENDYVYNSSIDTGGIEISKPLTIDGNNHIIDADSKSRIFNINSDNIVLKNIIFKGGSAGTGGAIINNINTVVSYSGNIIPNEHTAYNCEISSCDFINCHANNGRGGAIYNARPCTCNINSCNFINCSAMDTKDNPRGGGAIYGDSNCNINSCNFTGCSANYGGGAISTNYDTTCNINSCNFSDCSAEKGGAIFSGDYGIRENMANLYVENSIFTNNKASSDGGAICTSQSNLDVLNCIFINNYGDAINAESFYYSENTAVYPYSNEVSYHCNILIKDSNFTNNANDICGDDHTGKYIKVINCIFDDNNLTNDTSELNNLTNNTGDNSSETNATKTTPEIVVPHLDEPSEDGLIPVTLPNDATGTVTLTVDGKDYVFDVVDGKANVKLPDLGNGDYPYTISYSGDTKYKSFTTSGSLKVNITTVNPSDNTTNATENVTTGNTTDTNTTNSTGGNASETNTTKPTPEIVVPPLDKPSDDGSVTITLPSDATGKVTLSINGKSYNYVVENGVVNVIIPNLGDGDYPYTITYSGDTKYSSFTNNGSLKVNKTSVNPIENQTNSTVNPADNKTGNTENNTSHENTTVVDNSKIVASNVKVTYAAGSYYTITVYGTNGELADGETVKVTGKISKSLITTNGVAKFKVTQVPGTYKIIISALGKSVTKTIAVKHLVTLKTVTVKKSAKKLVLQATLGKINGKYLKNKKITFKFNGKKYTAKTNSKGVAKVTIKSSVLKKLKVGKKVTYQATYSKDTVKKTVKVKR